jgi:hypothetical protein
MLQDRRPVAARPGPRQDCSYVGAKTTAAVAAVAERASGYAIRPSLHGHRDRTGALPLNATRRDTGDDDPSEQHPRQTAQPTRRRLLTVPGNHSSTPGSRRLTGGVCGCWIMWVWRRHAGGERAVDRPSAMRLGWPVDEAATWRWSTFQDDASEVGGGSPSPRAAQGRAVANSARCAARARGARPGCRAGRPGSRRNPATRPATPGSRSATCSG